MARVEALGQLLNEVNNEVQDQRSEESGNAINFGTSDCSRFGISSSC